MLFNWVLFVVSVFAAFMIHLQIVNVEEDYLNSSFGESYLEYKKNIINYFSEFIQVFWGVDDYWRNSVSIL